MYFTARPPQCDGKSCGTGKHAGGGRYVCAHNNLKVVVPKLMAFWSPKNTVRPELLLFTSRKKVWWKCIESKCDCHHWEASISSLACIACPFCLGLTLCPHTNLATVLPQHSAEWHPTRNEDLKPNMISHKSSEKVWWKCSKSTCGCHEWCDSVVRKQLYGCPFCEGEQICPHNNLKSRFPEIAAEWHPDKNEGFLPEHFPYGSSDTVWWKCCKGECDCHEWRGSIGSRTKYDASCPFCTEQEACSHNNLVSKYPEVAAYWHFEKNGDLLPTNFTSQSCKMVWWKCDNSHEWKMSIRTMSANGSNCSMCSDQGESLQSKRPRIAKEWHPTKNGDLLPSDVPSNASLKVWWKCTEGNCDCHEWEERVWKRAESYTPCPFCQGDRACPHNNLSTRYPDVALEWHPTKNEGLNPSTVPYRSDLEVWWLCSKSECGCHEWMAPISNRRWSRCPYCEGVKSCPHTNFRTKYPDLAAKWHPTKNGTLQPDQIPFKHDKKVWWKCSKGECDCHEWEMSPYDMQYYKFQCPFCTDHLMCPHNNLVVNYPHLALEWHLTRNESLDPCTITLLYTSKVWWKCSNEKCMHEWQDTLYQRIKKEKGCPSCQKANRLIGCSGAQIAWIQSIEKEQGITIQHALSLEGEYKIPNVGKVDGYCRETNTVYEFHGDYWHGNPKKFRPDLPHPTIQGKTFGELYQRTIERDDEIRALGYNLVVKWETSL